MLKLTKECVSKIGEALNDIRGNAADLHNDLMSLLTSIEELESELNTVYGTSEEEQ